MKRHILVFCVSILFSTAFGQQSLNIYKSNLSVDNILLSNIDSITLGNNKSIKVFTKAGEPNEIIINNLDSLNFNPFYLQTFPTLEQPELSNVLNTTAEVSFKVLSPGGTSVSETGICWSTNENPTIEDFKLQSLSLAAANTLNISGLNNSTSYYLRAYAANEAGVAYSSQVSIKTNDYQAPNVETISATYNYTTNKATCIVKVNDNGGCPLTERGIVWATKRNPTLADNKFSSGKTIGQFYAQTEDLELNKTYYVRSFATNCLGTSYGNELTIKPLMGNVSYTLSQNVINAGTQTYNLIKTAMDSACYYYNRYTPFRANIWIDYNAGIPTAQASYHGSIGFGPNERYMWVGTAMHEMAHYFGSGTTTQWRNLLVGGLWQGAVAKALCLQLTGETLKGDNNNNAQHYWPTGINQREEVKSQTDLINHARIVKAMLVDDAKLPTSW